MLLRDSFVHRGVNGKHHVLTGIQFSGDIEQSKRHHQHRCRRVSALSAFERTHGMPGGLHRWVHGLRVPH